MNIYSKRYYMIQDTKYHLSNAIDSIKSFISNAIDKVRYANDDTWLAIALVTTWIFCIYVASVN